MKSTFLIADFSSSLGQAGSKMHVREDSVSHSVFFFSYKKCFLINPRIKKRYSIRIAVLLKIIMK